MSAANFFVVCGLLTCAALFCLQPLYAQSETEGTEEAQSETEEAQSEPEKSQSETEEAQSETRDKERPESLIYGWSTNIEEAVVQATEEDKHLFVYFAGSDWCPFCENFDKKVISAPVFYRFLDKEFVPVLIDFPRSIPISEEQVAYNDEKAALYDIRGFPTVVILDKNGEEIHRTGYGGGGARRFRSQLSEHIE